MSRHSFNKWDRHEVKGPNGRMMVFIPGTLACVELAKLKVIVPIVKRKGGTMHALGNDLLLTWPTGQMRLYGFEYRTASTWPRQLGWHRAESEQA